MKPSSDLGITYARLVAVAVLAGPAAGCRNEQAPGQPNLAATRPSTMSATSSAPTSMPVWHRPRFADHRADRVRMVERQIAHPGDGRDPVRDEAVLEAVRNVPRHLFVRPGDLPSAHDDGPLPIGYGQTISQPYIVALMTEALKLTPGAKVLEIGTGSGYQAAVLAELTPHVYSIEIVKPLAEQAAARLKRLGYHTVAVREGDGYYGWPEAAPFDGIIVTCAAGHLPPPLWEQLKPGGRIVIPIGGFLQTQRLTVLTKTTDGKRQSEVVTLCAFVPMTGQIQK